MPPPEFENYAPLYGKTRQRCEWCRDDVARYLWIKVPEVAGKRYRKPVKILVCGMCKETISRNFRY